MSPLHVFVSFVCCCCVHLCLFCFCVFCSNVLLLFVLCLCSCLCFVLLCSFYCCACRLYAFGRPRPQVPMTREASEVIRLTELIKQHSGNSCGGTPWVPVLRRLTLVGRICNVLALLQCGPPALAQAQWRQGTSDVPRAPPRRVAQVLLN